MEKDYSNLEIELKETNISFKIVKIFSYDDTDIDELIEQEIY